MAERRHLRVSFLITPIGKPRQTRSDRWKLRPAVLRYRAFADQLRLQSATKRFSLPNRFRVEFYLPMPSSWSARKRQQLEGQPHQQKPDIDNLCKALMDPLLPDDAAVWSIAAVKLWSREGRIVIETVDEPAEGRTA